MNHARRTSRPAAVLTTGFFTVLAGSAGAENKNWDFVNSPDANWHVTTSWVELAVPIDGESVLLNSDQAGVANKNAVNDIDIDNAGSGVNLPTSAIRFEHKTRLYDSGAGDLSDVQLGGGGSYDFVAVNDGIIADTMALNGRGGGSVNVYVPVTANLFTSNRHGANFYVPYTVTTIEARSGHQDHWNFNVSPTAPIDTVIIDENRGPDGGNTDGYVAFNADTQVTSLTLVWSNLRVGAGATLSVGTLEYSDFTNQATNNSVTPIRLDGDMVVGAFNITDVTDSSVTPLALGTYGRLGNPGVDNQVPWITQGDGILTVVGTDRMTLVAGTTYPTMSDAVVLNTAALNSSVGSLIGLNNAGVPAPATFTLVSGTGATNNGNYVINGDRLEVNADLSGLANDTPQSVRIEADFGGGDVFPGEFTFKIKIDSDTDGLVDDWETTHGALGDFATGNDKDSDGLNDEEEFVLGTIPNNADPDKDDSPDGEEIARMTDPTDPDTDDDGLKDGHETDTGTYASPTDTGSDPLVDDTDGDGLLDGEEVAPTAPRPQTDPNNADTDGDSLSDLVENNSGTFNGAGDPGTDPTKTDTDGDGIGDISEIMAGSNPVDMASVPAPPDFTDGLVAYWPFNGNPGDLADGHDGILMNGAVITSGGEGFLGEALSLGANGNSTGFNADYMSATDPASFDFNNDFTWHAYVKTTDASGGIFSRSQIAGNWNQGSKAMFLSNGGELRWDTGWVGQPRSFVKPHDGQWHQITATYVAATDELKMYIDPVLDAPTPVYSGTHNVNRFDEHTHTHNGGMAETDFRIGMVAPNFQNNGLTALIDEAAVWNRALNGYEVAYLHEQGLGGTSLGDLAGLGGAPVLTVETVGSELKFSWTTRTGKIYDILSENSLGTDPATWPVWEGDLQTSPLMKPIPAEQERFFVLLEKDAPPLFEETFDAATGGPAGWTAAGNGAGTAWEVNDPATGPPEGPDAASSGANCAGTNITANYTASADVTLTTPVIAIPAGGATLSFQQYIDTDGAGDVGTVRLLDADNADAEIIDGDFPVTPIEGIEDGWSARSFILPAAALGKNVKVQFQFVSDADTEVYSGFYIDDVVVDN